MKEYLADLINSVEALTNTINQYDLNVFVGVINARLSGGVVGKEAECLTEARNMAISGRLEQAKELYVEYLLRKCWIDSSK